MANAMFCQHRFEIRIRNFVPQRLAFHFIGVDIVCAGDVAQQIKFRCAPGRFNHFPLAGRRSRDRLTLLELVQPLRVDQLLEVGETLEARRGLQGITQQRDLAETRLIQPRLNGLVIAVVYRTGQPAWSA